MSSDNSPADAAKTNDTNPVTENNEPKLLRFDENNTVSSGRDINTKITALDTDLAHLRAELGAINSSVEEGRDRLGDTDTDLTAKVSETYKRLGEIDNAYKSLIEISSRIDSDIQKLNGDVSTVAEQSASGIKTLEQSTVAQSNEFAYKNQQVATKVNRLVETSKLTGELLSQKIKTTTEKMLQMEKHVVAEIESLSSAMNDKTDAIEVSVESNKAKILKLQSVDEVIIKRATTLEISSAELTVKSQDLQASVEQLQQSTSELSTGLSELREKTRALEDIASNHGSLINSLQQATSDITGRLAVVAGRERRHFNIFTVSFLLLLIATAVIYFYQQSQFDNAEAKMALQSKVVDNKLVSLQQLQSSSNVTANESIAELKTKVAELNAVMQEEINKEIALVNHQVQNIQDQVRSVDARLTNDLPFSQIGNDNVIHGEQWIAELPKQNFIVQLAYVDSMNTMFELAQRYNYYLKNSLSYFEVDNNGDTKGDTKYVLLSGNYVTQQQAEAQIRSMPRYIDMQQPVVQKLDDVQKHIAQK